MVSQSYNAEELEKGDDAHKQNIINGLKRRSSVTLKAIARTFSVPGGKNIVNIPSPQQQQSPTLHEEEEKVSECSTTNTHERSAACYSNAMSDAELTATEAVGGNESGPQVAPICSETTKQSSRSSSS